MCSGRNECYPGQQAHDFMGSDFLYDIGICGLFKTKIYILDRFHILPVNIAFTIFLE